MIHIPRVRARLLYGVLFLPFATLAFGAAAVQAATVQHMYVSQGPAHQILRFPLNAGIPAQQPDAVIGGASDPRGIAIGPDGRLYVVDRGTKNLLIYEPAPGSTSKPSHVLPIGRQIGLGAIAVDQFGYVYLSWAHRCATEGFLCGYADVRSDLASGLNLVSVYSFGGGPGGSVIQSMSVSSEQKLVDEAGGAGPRIWSNAPKGHAIPYALLCGASIDSGNVWGGPQTLYETDLGGGQPPSAPQIVIIPDYLKGSPNCPAFYSITSATVPLQDPFAIATSGGLIYVSGSFNKTIGSALVFVFDPAKAGSQTPLTIVEGPRSQLRSPQGIAVGP